jgi:hypothetical protein
VSNRVFFDQRAMPTATAAARFIRPTHIADGGLHGFCWDREARRELPVYARLPRGVPPDEALEAAAEGRLVLLPGLGFRLGWARS